MNIDTITALVDQAADKDKVPIHCDGLWTFSTEELERFAALIEAEVRGDAEPVAYETDTELWAADDPDINEWIRQNGRPLYAHHSGAGVRQLVEALRMVLDDPNALDGRPRTSECVQEALAAVKENGL